MALWEDGAGRGGIGTGACAAVDGAGLAIGGEAPSGGVTSCGVAAGSILARLDVIDRMVLESEKETGLVGVLVLGCEGPAMAVEVEWLRSPVEGRAKAEVEGVSEAEAAEGGVSDEVDAAACGVGPSA